MTIAKVTTSGALTKAEHDALNLTRPLTDAPIGSTTHAKRQASESASRAFDEADRPAVSSNRRAVGPRGYLLANGELAYTDRKEPA